MFFLRIKEHYETITIRYKQRSTNISSQYVIELLTSIQ